MSFIRNLVDLAIPQSCAGCGILHSEVCLMCSKALSGPAHLVDVKGIGKQVFPIVASAFYQGAARNILIAAKERSQVRLIPVIAQSALTAAVSLLKNVPTSIPLSLIPVPSMPGNLRSRGYNLVFQMTELVADHLRMQFNDVRVVPILQHARRVNDQSRLSARQRAANLDNAFTHVDRYLGDLENREVVILDDLITTGSTLLEARRSLLSVNAKLRGAACAMSSP